MEASAYSARLCEQIFPRTSSYFSEVVKVSAS